MLCITFDNFGCGSGKFPPCPFPDIVPKSEWDNYNEIGLSLGHPRILNLLRQLGIRTTYFAEGYSAVLHPDEMKRWRDEGHELALHGWKHEMWNTLQSKEQEEALVEQAVEAMTSLLGEGPVGFRPPGMRINAWSDDIFEKHGITYVCQILEREQDQAARFAKLGIPYSRGSENIIISRLRVLPTSDRLIDGDLIEPRDGGFFGDLSAEDAYERFFEMAVAHENATPKEPWVFIIHPHISGSRGWRGLESFLRKLCAEFGPDRFQTAREAAFA